MTNGRTNSKASIAQVIEHHIGNVDVPSLNLGASSTFNRRNTCRRY